MAKNKKVVKEAKPVRHTKSIRMTDNTIGKMDEMALLLKESPGDIIQRAIDMLYENRVKVYEDDIERRRKSLESNKV